MTKPTASGLTAPVELELSEDRDGVWRSADEAFVEVADVSVSTGGALTVTGGEGRTLSTVPSERMAADAWQSVFEQIRADEEGRGGGNGVYVAPGGTLEVRPSSDAQGRPLSKVPEVRMAASAAEAEELRRLDPHNVEGWVPVSSAGGRVDGWRFRLKDPFADRYFVFLTFRNPSRRNLWDISPVLPVMDDKFGHDPHMIRTVMGTETVPIICGPGGEPAPSLTAVRGVAGKWMYYTAAKLAGRTPGFSL